MIDNKNVRMIGKGSGCDNRGKSDNTRLNVRRNKGGGLRIRGRAMRSDGCVRRINGGVIRNLGGIRGDGTMTISGCFKLL